MSNLRPRILIIEDNAFIASDVERLLVEALDCEVRCESFAAASEEFARNGIPDAELVVLEVGFDHSERLSFAKKLIDASVLLLITTTSDKLHEINDLKEVPIIRRPYETSELSAAVSGLLSDGRISPAVDE